jgi:hypothetical protein
MIAAVGMTMTSYDEPQQVAARFLLQFSDISFCLAR